jgi:hypothetical protein
MPWWESVAAAARRAQSRVAGRECWGAGRATHATGVAQICVASDARMTCPCRGSLGSHGRARGSTDLKLAQSGLMSSPGPNSEILHSHARRDRSPTGADPPGHRLRPSQSLMRRFCRISCAIPAQTGGGAPFRATANSRQRLGAEQGEPPVNQAVLECPHGMVGIRALRAGRAEGRAGA